jgi:hypothetical protein
MWQSNKAACCWSCSKKADIQAGAWQSNKAAHRWSCSVAMLQNRPNLVCMFENAQVHGIRRKMAHVVRLQQQATHVNTLLTSF